MATICIVKRKTKSGPRYVVRYRLGGRDTPMVHAGSYKLLSLAKTRRNFIAGEIAAGRDPAEVLKRLKGE